MTCESLALDPVTERQAYQLTLNSHQEYHLQACYMKKKLEKSQIVLIEPTRNILSYNNEEKKGA